MVYGDKFPIIGYYRKVVVPADPKRYWVKGDKMMVCPLHGDVNPSMGIMKGKDGEEIYHCFGCNSWGNVVDLHRRVSKRLFNRYMSEDEAIKDLCRKFGVDYSDVQGSEDGDSFDDDMRRDMAMRDAVDRFDISDYRGMMLEGKREGKGIAYFNTLMMVMIDTIKKENAQGND